MSPVSSKTPTAVTSATGQPTIMSANTITSISTMPSSNMVIALQSASSNSPLASTVSTTTVFIYSQEPPSTNSTFTTTKPLIPEPYNSIIPFIAAIAGIVYLFGYTVPHCRKNFMKWLRRKQLREQQLAKKREEKEERREKKEAKLETRTYQIHQMQSAADLVQSQHAHAEETKGIRESVDKVVTGIQILPEAMVTAMAEVIKGAVKEGYENGAKDAMKGMEEIITKAVTEGTKNGYKEGFKDAMKGMEEVITKAVAKGNSEGIKDAMREVNQTTSDGVDKVVTAVQGMEKMMKVGLEEMDLRIRGIEYRADWMLDYLLDENERFYVLKAILIGLWRKDDTTSTPNASWGGDSVEKRTVSDESDWKDQQKPWES